MRPLLNVGLFAIALVAGVASGSPVSPSHPILGTWTFDLPDGTCSETYRFRSDGSTIVTSADEVAESTYTVAATPSKNGFYKWVDKIIKDNGKKDCSGQITTPGKTITNFIRFDASREMLIVCRQESSEECFGPLRRVHGQDS